MSEFKDRIHQMLQEVQGDFFTNEFEKEDARVESIWDTIKRLEAEKGTLEDEARDWESRPYKPNTKTIKDSRGNDISIGQSNERRRRNEVASRRLQVKRLEAQIEELKAKI